MLTACVSVLLLPLHTAAQSTSGFESNAYALDVFTGPVLGPGRIVGMAGAYGAVATGIDGSMLNPAGYAERAQHELEWVSWELTGGIWLGGLFADNDFDNNGRRGLDAADAVAASAGGRLQLGNFGLGVTGILQHYALRNAEGPLASVSISTVRIGAGYAFWRGGLVIGAGSRTILFELKPPDDSGEALVSFRGIGLETGALIRPAHKRYRLSAVIRREISSRPSNDEQSETSNGVRVARGLVLPSKVHVPWEADLGIAYQFGARRSNVPWRNPRELKRELKQQVEAGTYEPPALHGGSPYPLPSPEPSDALRVAMENEREAARRRREHEPRTYVLVSGDILLFGKTPGGQGVAAFLRQRPEASGRDLAVGARLGVETEAWPHRLKLRGGTYLEPSRFRRSDYRPHLTAGGDVRLFESFRWSVRATTSVDWAPRYFDWGVSFGLWY